MYDADQAAMHLGLKKTTLSYWHRMLGDISPAAGDDDKLLFTDGALRTFAWLKHVIINDNWTMTQARTALAHGAPELVAAETPPTGSLHVEPLAAVMLAMQQEIDVLAEECKHMHRLLAHVIELLTAGHPGRAVSGRPPRHFHIVRPRSAPAESRPRHDKTNSSDHVPWPPQPRPHYTGLKPEADVFAAD